MHRYYPRACVVNKSQGLRKQSSKSQKRDSTLSQSEVLYVTLVNTITLFCVCRFSRKKCTSELSRSSVPTSASRLGSCVTCTCTMSSGTASQSLEFGVFVWLLRCCRYTAIRLVTRRNFLRQGRRRRRQRRIRPRSPTLRGVTRSTLSMSG